MLGEPEEEPAPAATDPEPKAAPPPPEPSPAPDSDALSVGPLAAGMAADRLKDPKVLGAVLGGAVFLGYLIGRRS
jgi:hypothetical protein